MVWVLNGRVEEEERGVKSGGKPVPLSNMALNMAQ